TLQRLYPKKKRRKVGSQLSTHGRRRPVFRSNVENVVCSDAGGWASATLAAVGDLAPYALSTPGADYAAAGDLAPSALSTPSAACATAGTLTSCALCIPTRGTADALLLCCLV